MAGKGRPEKLTDDIKEIITSLQRDRSKKLKAPAIQKEVRNYLRKQILEYVKKNNLDWSEKMIAGEVELRLPGVSRIGKYLKELNPRIDSQSKFDKPWHLGKTPGFLAEAIAAIFEVVRWLEKEKDDPGIASKGIKEWTEYYTENKMTTGIWPLTIREAYWITKLYKVRYILSESERLYFLIHERGKHPPQNTTRQKLNDLFNKESVPFRRTLVENPSELWRAAKTYADYQRLCELADTDFNTSRLDEALRNSNIATTKLALFSEYKDHLNEESRV